MIKKIIAWFKKEFRLWTTPIDMQKINREIMKGTGNPDYDNFRYRKLMIGLYGKDPGDKF